MPGVISLLRFLVSLSMLLLVSVLATAQRSPAPAKDDAGADFGPVVRAYLGYLNNEQEVVDDRASRREITPGYYRRNSNRIRALRQTAIRLVGQSGNDYVPELEAVTQDELGTLFENPPKPTTFRTNEIIANKFRFLAAVHTGEVFYVFARLDPYEQAEQSKRQSLSAGSGSTNGQRAGQTMTRPRRTVPN